MFRVLLGGWRRVLRHRAKVRAPLTFMQSVETVLVDFHTHTTASDGALTPSELVARAADRGVSVMAITDHDTMAGFEAVRSEVPDGLTLHAGVELSCVWGSVNIHIVGLGVSAEQPALQDILTTLDTARRERARTIAERLEKVGMPGALSGAMAIAGDSQIGRPHFAAWMVQAGHASDESQAFDKWLGRGKRGDVKTFWPHLSEVVAAIVQAGGVPVLAHPLKYGMTGMKLTALVRDFVAAGGLGLEIASGRQTGDETARLRRLALEHGLSVSLGSDFHRDWTYGPELGVDATVAGAAPGVWELLS